MTLGRKTGGRDFGPGNPGRRKDVRNRLTVNFLEAMADDFEKHGVQTIERVRMEDPAIYLQIIQRTLPKEIKVDKSDLQELSDAELARVTAALAAELGLNLVARGASAKAAREQAGDLPPVH